MIRASAFFLVFAAAPISGACMGVGSGNQPVRFSGQRNIIVWDEAHGIEHFVRDAQFETDGDSLGFIAPTPGRPSIEAVNAGAFSLVESLNPIKLRSTSVGGLGGGGGFGGGGVSIVERKAVAGYEATVLRASNPHELTNWLKTNGYGVPRFATRWAMPYVANGWYFTAFKVAAGNGLSKTGPVRMSFRTDRPFNPYSVPAENGGSSGLSLYYVSAGSEVPKIGGARPWVGAQWAAPLPESSAQQLASELKLPADAIPAKSGVRFYRDERFGRPGFDDIYFVPTPKPVVGPGFEAVLLALGFGVFAFARPNYRKVF